MRGSLQKLWFLLLFLPASLSAAQTVEREDLYQTFVQAGIDGTFVLFTPSQNRLVLVNAKRAAVRYYPASTFKIANSLIALETGVVKDENEIIPYGGKPQLIKSWERDMSMRSAIKISNVPVYQELASRVGRERYVEWMTRLNYGNGKVGDDVTSFWLKGPLKISAVEQVMFLAKLATKNLPVSKRSQTIVADILKLEKRDNKSIYAKTGWTNATNPDLGWFVGWIIKDNLIHTFALNIDIKNRADAKLHKALSIKLLMQLGKY